MPSYPNYPGIDFTRYPAWRVWLHFALYVIPTILAFVLFISTESPWALLPLGVPIAMIVCFTAKEVFGR